MLLLLAIMPISSQLKAQSFFGTIVGTVADTSGAVVFGATVKVTNVGTDTAQTVTSEPSGRYTAVNLVPGTYRVEVTKTTFKRFVRDDVVVEVGQTTRVDAPLQVGAVSETVEVSTTAPLLQTDSSTLSQEIEGAQVQEEPLNGRNVMNLVALAPGVVPTGGAMGTTGLDQANRTAGGQGFGNYEIGGAIQGQSGNYLDGVANVILGGNALALVPTQDAIQEFSVASSNAGAEFGRYSGGVVNMTTRSGSNAWHGSVWEYNRNRDYNANDFFSNQTGTPRGVWNQNQYGASGSGPLKKDKVFFTFTWESLKLLTSLASSVYVPTVAEQNGVFPKTISADPQGICNVAAYAGQTLPNGLSFPSGGTYISNLYVPGGGLKAGTTCGDPSNQVMKQFYPIPNTTALSNANYFSDFPLGNHQEQYNARVDVTLSAKQRLFFRYSYWAPTDIPHTEFNDQGYKNGTTGNGTTWPTADGASSYFTTQGVAGDTITINPTTVADVRLTYIRQYAPNFAQGLNVNEAQFDGGGGNGYFATLSKSEIIHEQPSVGISGGDNFYQLTSYTNSGITWDNTYGAAATFTKIVGPHTIKIGGEFREMDTSAFNPGGGGGSGAFTYGNQAWMKDEWANFLVGYSSTGTFKSSAETAAYIYYQGYYVTDSFQAARNLTINAGLRYELPGVGASRHNAATVLLPNTVDPLTGIMGTTAFVASSLYSPRTTNAPLHNLFAPNLGFAYRASDKTVIRGGYGISYLPLDINGGWNPAAATNSATTAWNHSTAGSNPTSYQLQTDLANTIAGGGVPASGARYPTAATQPTLFLSGVENIVTNPTNSSFITGLPATTSTVNYLNKALSGPVTTTGVFPFTQHWNAAISHEFKGNMLVEVSYNGLKGLNMPEIGSRQFNLLPDSILLSSAYSAVNSTGQANATTNATTAGLAASAAAGYTGCQTNPVQAPGLLAGQQAGTNSNNFTIGQCAKPYPFVSGLTDSLGYYAIENYHAFAARMEKRVGAGGVLNANYTYAKNMGNTDTQAGFVEQGATVQGASADNGIQDYNNLKSEYSLISYDVTNRVIVNYVLSMPFGKGKKYANSLGNAGNAVVSGWTLNGITTFQSGFPIFLKASGSSGTKNVLANRPLVVPGCNAKIGGSGLARYRNGAWFNLNCFEDTGTTTNQVYSSSGTVLQSMTNPYLPTGWSTGYLYGNEPRTDPTLRSDGVKDFDVSVGKSTAVWEKANLAFRVEFYNIMNRVQFAPPGPSVGASQEGAIVYQVNHPRQLQMSLRLNY